ncbi:alpha/beta hydrolase [Sphingobacterium sp. lm-10]|uniref:alpha/beta fold hydrolase n=1 Tax=Sphingobacterium sp. lm-10 TaxID=2944904 RepID=UPI002021F344|nr:alpha/beta hydrolase [Sphingobacterium sp. lm-10]
MQKEHRTILFLHGFPFNKNMWKAQLEALDDSTTGIALDIRGHGNTTSGHGFLSIDLFAKDLIAFIKKMEMKQVILCGISMGGYIALRAYELAPTLFSGLILSDTHSKADDKIAKQKRFDSIQAVLTHGRRPFAIGFIENIFAKPRAEENLEAVELIKSSIRRNSLTSICATLLALASRTDTSDLLPNITIPTLLVRGQHDKITPETLMLEMKDHIPQSEFVSIEGSGHLPNLENPAAFNAALSAYLNRLPSGTTI